VPPRRQSYRDIADDIESRIHRGEYPPGSALPSAAGLADIYKVSKATAERALALLKDRGLTEGVVGVGTFVAMRTGRE
jgi:GntR family transcriptional regulator